MTARASNGALFSLATFFAALQLAAAYIGPYGIFHDEAYYWACAKRPGLGYVDHPPLSAWALAVSMAIVGDGRLALGLLPALCAAGTVVLTGLMACRLGAGTFGQCLAGLGVMATPLMLVLFSFYSVNAIEILLWTATTFVLMELLRTRDERLWLAIGGLAGIGLLNKHTFALLAFGLGIGMLATPLREQLRSRWLWLGGGLAFLLVLPNLLWNAEYGWPSLAFYRSRPTADLPATVAEALALQIMGASPALLWIPGVLYLLFSRRGRPYRLFGVAFAVLFAVILFSGHRRVDRIAGIYPIAVAAGATLWDQWRGRWHRAARVTLLVLVVALGALILPATLPLLPPQAVADYFAAIGAKPEIEKVDLGQKIPLHFLGRLEWERFVGEVMAAWQTLPAEERQRSVVLAPHWVFAAVIEYYSRNRDHPPVVAPHNAYWFWRQDAAGRDVVISVAVDPQALSRYFAQTRALGTFRCEHCASFRPDMPIYVSTGSVRPLVELLSEWRYFSIQAAPALIGQLNTDAVADGMTDRHHRHDD